jgi:DNA-binding transcriptional LysR family regulator
MDAKQLRIFVAIVEAQTFTRAGRRLGLSQPAISQQLSALERQLGVPLLVRTPQGARPTAAGEVLLAYGRRILQQFDQAQRALSDFDEVGNGTLRLGAGPAACEYLLPPIVGALRDAFPRLAVQITSGGTKRTRRRLQHGLVDVGLVGLPVPESAARVVELGREELVAVAVASHGWAGQPYVTLAQLAAEPLLVYGRRGQIFRRVERVLLQAGLFPHVAMEADQMGAILGVVRRGLGVAVVPRWAVTGDVAAGRLLAARVGETGGLFRTRALVVSEHLHPCRAVRSFVQLCSERLPAVLAAAADVDPATDQRCVNGAG